MRASWGCTSSQGLDCSSIKALPDLSSDRSDAGRLISACVEDTKFKRWIVREDFQGYPSDVSVVGKERHSRVVKDKNIRAEGK